MRNALRLWLRSRWFQFGKWAALRTGVGDAFIDIGRQGATMDMTREIARWQAEHAACIKRATAQAFRDGFDAGWKQRVETLDRIERRHGTLITKVTH